MIWSISSKSTSCDNEEEVPDMPDRLKAPSIRGLSSCISCMYACQYKVRQEIGLGWKDAFRFRFVSYA